MSQQTSLKRKFILFFIGYTLLLLGGVLGYFLISGYLTIKNRSAREVVSYTNGFSDLLVKELNDSIAELIGLKTNFEIYLPPENLELASLKLIEDFTVSYPYKYSSFILYNKKSHEMVSVCPKFELGEIYPLVQRKQKTQVMEEYLGMLKNGRSDVVRVFGPEIKNGARHVRIFLPLQGEDAPLLFADLRLDYLITQSSEKLSLDPAFSSVVADNQGVIIHSSNVALLQKYIQDVMPEFDFDPGKINQVEGESFEKGVFITHLKHLDQPDVFLVIQKNLSSEMLQWRRETAGVLLFAGFMALCALLVIWLLTDRMARSLRDMTRVAHLVAGGDFSQKIDIQRNDELGLLIRAFNHMTDTLQDSYHTLNVINKQLADKIKELTRARMELSQKQRLALLGEAISKISHEIQNKIGGVSIWLQNLEKHSAKDETSQLYILEMKGALSSFMDMLVNFKRFYRKPQLNKNLVPVSELIETSLSHLKSDLNAKQLKIITQLDDERSILADKDQLVDALVNIVLNAVYFSPENGCIRIRSRRKRKWVVLSVCDEGPGINEKDKKKLFQPFFSAKPSGSGLGLAIVSNIVKAHRGKMRGVNRAGRGACFEIRLPARIKPNVPPSLEPEENSVAD